MRITVPRLALFTALLAAAGASTAWPPASPRSDHYVCSNGEQFTVDYFPDYVHLRTGAGIFALSATAGATERYSDGHTVFRLQEDIAALERPGLPSAEGCRAQRRLS